MVMIIRHSSQGMRTGTTPLNLTKMAGALSRLFDQRN